MAEDLLKAFLEQKVQTFEQELTGTIEKKVQEISSKLEDKIKEIDQRIESGVAIPRMLKLEGLKSELAHSKLQDLVNILCSCRRSKKIVLMVGAAGAGKSKMVSQAARVFKLDFYPMSIGAQTTKSDLMGFMNAQGEYTTSPVRMAFENGGILLLDELDAGNSGTLTILNNLLSNDEVMFPDGRVKKHQDFQCVCTANTYGKGGTFEYVGRNKLDAATLDRFVVMDINYDEELEKALTRHKEWQSVIKKARRNCERYDIKLIISPRASMNGADLIDGGFSYRETLDMVVFKGASDDIKCKVLEGIVLPDEKAKSEQGE